MFVPRPYAAPDSSWLADLARLNPLAMLISSGAGDSGPHVTHLPAITDPDSSAEPGPGLAGAVFLGHLNRVNPHWKALRDKSDGLLVFTGPHAYVSPTVYRTDPAAPTWNFTAVHAHGTLELLAPGDETLQVVMATVRAFEAEFGAGWDMSSSLGYFRRILPAVGAFRFTVTRAEGMFKLSQEQSPEIRGRVIDEFASRACGRHRETAQMMQNVPDRTAVH